MSSSTVGRTTNDGPSLVALESKPFSAHLLLLKTTYDPCVSKDCGGAFAMGAIGGAIWHGFKGFRNSPRGERIPGAIMAMKVRSPILGGWFANL